MSQIDDMAQELAPHRVRYAAIGDVAEVSSGATPASGRSDYWENGTIPWMNSGEVNLGTVYGTARKITQAGYDSCSTKLLPPNTVVMALAGQGKTRGLVARTRIALCTNQSLAGILPNGSVDADFLFYFLQTQYQNLRSISSGDGTRGGLNLQMIRGYRIPVPPLDVQHEIVRVLDRFAELERALESALEAEIEARILQYAHYRDSLIASSRAGPVERIRMGDIGTFVRGRRFTKADVALNGVPSIHYGEIYTAYGVSTATTVSKVRIELAGQLGYAQPGDVVIAGVGETVEDVGKAVAWLGDVPVAIHDDTFRYRSTLNPTYVSYFLQTADFHRQKDRHVARAKVKRLSAAGLAQIVIPVPPLVEQERIASVLNDFHAAITDLRVGLLAELKTRRKQYEYFRDLLLTFEEATV